MDRKTNPPVTDPAQKPFIRTQWNRHLHARRYERFKQPSMTIPDQTMTISELLRRHANGLPYSGPQVPVYDENIDGEDPDFDDYMPDLSKMDLADAQLYREQALQDIRTAKENYSRELETKKAEQAKAHMAKQKKLEAVEELEAEPVEPAKPPKPPKHKKDD